MKKEKLFRRDKKGNVIEVKEVYDLKFSPAPAGTSDGVSSNPEIKYGAWDFKYKNGAPGYVFGEEWSPY